MIEARVFPRRTLATPDDPLCFIGRPDLFVPKVSRVMISVCFTWDLPEAERLYKAWSKVAPTELGGPALGTRGEEFEPGRFLKLGYTITSRGCPNKCLSGATPIQTTDGVFQIKDLIGKQPLVLTRERNGNLLFAKATKVAKTGSNRKLVRVRFDNGDFIDCTPDHLFKVFKNGNQHIPLREYDTRADQLKKGDSVVAYNHYRRNCGYEDICYSLGGRELLHRLIMAGMLGRKLSRNEFVHHKDKNKANNIAENLEIIDPKTHTARHPEIAERMRKNNPTLKMTEEWRNKIKVAALGSRRSDEQKERYRISKLGPKNPRYKGGKRENHRVFSVEYLSKPEDTYCMEVPGYNWFFANGVLVHNCWFCQVWRRDGDVRELPIKLGWDVLDDNLLACSESHIRQVFDMLQTQPKKARFTGGLEAKRFQRWHAEALADLKPECMFFAYDTPDDLEPLVEAGRLLNQVGLLSRWKKNRVYVLCGYPKDRFDLAEQRMREAWAAGFFPMAMLWRDRKGEKPEGWSKFARYWASPIICGLMLKEPFGAWQTINVDKAR